MNKLGSVFTGIAIATLLVSGSACRRDMEPVESAAPPATVRAETRVARLDAVTLTSEATGSIEPRVRVAPGTKILGRVERVRVEVGEHVERGRVLAVLEQRDLAAAVQQSRAAVTMAEAELQKDEAQYRRLQELHRRGSVTDKNLEDATAGYRVSQAALEQARANLLAAEITFDYAEIRSPIAGFVTAKLVEAGDMARPGEPMFVLEDLSRVKVVVTVPESEVVGLEKGAQASITVDVLGTEHTAMAKSINPSGDPRSRTFQVQFMLDNPEGAMKSGMFARASFQRGIRDGLFVPAEAVVHRGALQGLFVLDDRDRGRLRWIRTGKTIDDGIEVLSGLSPGERYVVSPPLGFLDGAQVQEN